MSGSVSLIDGHIDEVEKKMTVNELINYLYKCNMDYEVLINGCDKIIRIDEIKVITDDSESIVAIGT